MNFRIMLVLSLILGASLACNLSQSKDATRKPDPVQTTVTTELSETAIPTDNLSAMQNYTDEVYGYSFDYPESWTSTGGGVLALTLFSYETDTINTRGAGVPEGETKIDLFVIPNQADITLDNLVEQYTANSTILFEEDMLLTDGTVGRMLHIQNNSFDTESNLFVTIMGDLGFVASGLGDSSSFRAIISTIRQE